MLWTVSLFAAVLPYVLAQIDPCPFEVQEYSAGVVLHCRGVSPQQQVSWQRIKSGLAADLGSCDPYPDDCLPTLPQLVTLSRSEPSVSSLTIVNASRDLVGGAEFRCSAFENSVLIRSHACVLDSVYKAEVNSCRSQPVLDSDHWWVQVSCVVDKVFSFLGAYSCQLMESQAENTTVFNVTFSPTTTTSNGSNLQYASGECRQLVPLQPLPTNYTMVVSPGPTRVFVSTISPVLPSEPPTMTCSPHVREYLPENRDISCTCSADDLGWPEGELLGYHGDVLVTSGNPGDSAVDFPRQTLSRDDDGAMYSCVLLTRWESGDQRKLTTNFTVRVAYGPENITLIDPGLFDFHPSGLATMTFTCNVTSFSPSVTFTWLGPCAGQTSSTCVLAPSVADDGETVTCVAHNQATNITLVDSKPVVLNYPPDIAPIISGWDGSPLQQGQSLNLTCHVPGGKPPVTAVTFTCQGQSEEVTGQSASLNLTVDAGNHGDRCTCAATWKRSGWYALRSEVILLVLEETVTPTVTVNQTGGVLTMNESPDDLLPLSCVALGVPSPTLVLLRDGTQQLTSVEGGQVTSQRSSTLTTAVPALCSSSATYTCVAQQEAQESLSAAVVLDVLCAPKLSPHSPSGNVLRPLANISSLEFSVESNPPPTTLTVLYLGAGDTASITEQPVGPSLFNVTCSRRTPVLSRQVCTVVVAVETDLEEGTYTLVVGNGVGAVLRVYFVVDLDAYVPTTERSGGETTDASLHTKGSEPMGVVIGLGAALAVVVLVLLIVAVVCLCRRRQQKENGTTTEGTGDGAVDVGGSPPSNYIELHPGRNEETSPQYDNGDGEYVTPTYPRQAKETQPTGDECEYVEMSPPDRNAPEDQGLYEIAKEPGNYVNVDRAQSPSPHQYTLCH